MTMRIDLPLTFAAAACLLGAAIAAPVPTEPAAFQELEVVRQVAGGVLTSPANPALQIRVDPSFRYLGAQRFVLRGVADAEQHVFAEVDAGKTVRRLYWIQFEQFLPRKGGEYNYASDTAAEKWGLTWRTHVRRFADPPASGSDRERVHRLIEQYGLRVPLPSVRARLVYVPAADRRQELMIIYLEGAGAADPTPADSARLVERAMAGLSISPSH
jgi:hypothetical protein